MPKPRTASEEFQALWDELDELRREKGIEQKKIAERSGFKRAAWFTYRKRGSIPFHLLERVAQELGARIEAQVVTKSSHGASVTRLAGKAVVVGFEIARASRARPRYARRMTDDLLILPGRTLAEVEEAAIRSAFERHGGLRRPMMRELRVSKSTLLRKLSRLGLRPATRYKPRHLREADIADAFERHRRLIVEELKISDSTFVRWLNTKAPFAVEE